jgi:hypothetical protein
MKRIIVILILIGSCPVWSFSMWALIPLDELVQDSDLIVIGTLNEVSEYSQDGMDYAQGSILIEEVVWGAAKAGQALALKWQNTTGLVCPRVEHRHDQGKKGIWLLTAEDNGEVVRANYPGRFLALSDRSKVERILVRKKVSLRCAKYVYGNDEPVTVSLVLRNATASPIEFPGIEYKDGRLVTNPDIAFSLFSGAGDEPALIDPIPERILLSENLPAILVSPGNEFRITVDLRTLFEVVPDKYYGFTANLKGFAPANGMGFYSEPAGRQKTSGSFDGRSPGSTIDSSRSMIDSDTLSDSGIKPNARDETLSLSDINSLLRLLIGSMVAVAGACLFVYRRRPWMK